MNKDYKKLYEEALERAKIKRDEYMRLDGPESYIPQDIEYIFPELAESEDERIRKTLLNHFKERIPLAVTWYGVKTSDIIAWLKKQKDQKATWSEEDEIGFNDTMWAIEQARTITKDENDMGNLWYAAHWLKSLKERMQPQPKQGEQNPITTPKFKAGDWVINELSGWTEDDVEVEEA